MRTFGLLGFQVAALFVLAGVIHLRASSAKRTQLRRSAEGRIIDGPLAVRVSIACGVDPLAIIVSRDASQFGPLVLAVADFLDDTTDRRRGPMAASSARQLGDAGHGYSRPPTMMPRLNASMSIDLNGVDEEAVKEGLRRAIEAIGGYVVEGTLTDMIIETHVNRHIARSAIDNALREIGCVLESVTITTV